MNRFSHKQQLFLGADCSNILRQILSAFLKILEYAVGTLFWLLNNMPHKNRLYNYWISGWFYSQILFWLLTSTIRAFNRQENKSFFLGNSFLFCTVRSMKGPGEYIFLHLLAHLGEIEPSPTPFLWQFMSLKILKIFS